MKLTYPLLMAFLTGFASGDTTGKEHEAVEYRNLLSQAVAQPSLNTFAMLGDAVYAMTRYSFSPADAELRDELVRGMTAIPGHARHFADELERQRELAAALPRRNQTEYDRWRVRHICEILRSLPSPETVQVLGEFLDDERDIVPPRTPAQNWVDIPDNALLACYALSNLGLRDAPFPKMAIFTPANLVAEHAGVLPKTRAWYAKVKAGKLPFSFLGQNVEYRFKPDGTWEATPLAISGETLRNELNPPVPPASAANGPPADAPRPSPASSSRWPWFAAGALVLLAATAWALRISGR